MHLPTESKQFPAWLDQYLKPLFRCEKLFCVHGDVIAGEVKATHWLASGYETTAFQSFTRTFEWSQRGCLKWWLQHRKPFLLDIQAPPPYASEFEIQEMHFSGLHSVVGHGLINHLAKEGSYFSLGNLADPLGPWHLELMELVMPVMHSQFLDFIHQQAHISLDMEGIPPRQREILRHTLRGLSDKEIALQMTISEKTVRNQLSKLYKILHVSSRMQLMAKLR